MNSLSHHRDLVRCVDIRPERVKTMPRINPETMEFAQNCIEYAIYELLEWMSQDKTFALTLDRMRLWYITHGCDAKLVAAKGEGTYSESRINAETCVLIYDGSIDKLWDLAPRLLMILEA